MPDITVSIEVYCARCGAGLCGDTNVARHRNTEAFEVEPCSKCIDASYDDGYQAAKDEVEA